MAVFRFPILLTEDFSGFVTAQAVGDDAVGFGTREEALYQVKEYLQWFYSQNWWREPEEFGEAQLIEFRVEVRPEYKVEPQRETLDEIVKRLSENRKRKKEEKLRAFAGTETLPLRVACVFRQEEAGSWLAVLPHFDIQFYYHDPKALKNLVTVYVQENLKGLTPLELSKFLPPRKVSLEEMTIQIRQRARTEEYVKAAPTLEKIAEPLGARDFTRKSAKAYERDAEVADLISRLTKERANILLLGESGVGKTTILTEAVKKIEEDLQSGKTTLGNAENNADADEDEKKPRHRFWQTNGGRIIAGMKYLGQWEERCEAIVEELSDIEGVLCVENLLDLIRAGGREPLESVAAFFASYLQRGEMRLIAEATPAELDACRRLLPGFADLFQIVRIPEFSREKALSVLDKIAVMPSRNTSIQLEQGSSGLVYRLFSRFLPYQSFPGKTPAFLVELFEKAAQKRAKEITRENIIENFVSLTGLPELFLRDEIPLEFIDVVSELESQVIGQPAACRTVASIVTTFKAGLNDPQRPLGVLLFVGQTGVGKTELAKALSKVFFGAGDSKTEERLIRLDMSEYSLPGSASRLLTSADGQPSDLIQQVRQQPFCVVLFDEIEKADAAVFDVLLGLFDEGRLTDRFGRVTNFRSAVIILTSNLGAEKFGGIGFGESAAPSYEREAQTFFRPEFFNRLDAVVQFGSLDSESLRQITEKELRSIARREGLREKGIELAWTTELVEFLAKNGFDARYGARPLQRTIETFVTAPLAKFLLANAELRNARLQIELIGQNEINFVILKK